MNASRCLLSVTLSFVLGLAAACGPIAVTETLPPTADAPKCQAPTAQLATDDTSHCSLEFADCSDGIKRELLCFSPGNGDGTYSNRLICSCAEDQASFDEVTLEGIACTAGASLPPASYEAAWRACSRPIQIQASK